jgi:hypothetical protein
MRTWTTKTVRSFNSSKYLDPPYVRSGGQVGRGLLTASGSPRFRARPVLGGWPRRAEWCSLTAPLLLFPHRGGVVPRQWQDFDMTDAEQLQLFDCAPFLYTKPRKDEQK